MTGKASSTKTARRKSAASGEPKVHAIAANGNGGETVFDGDAGTTGGTEPGPAPASSGAIEVAEETDVAAVAIGQSQPTVNGAWPIDADTVAEVVRERQTAFIVFIDKEERVRWLTAFTASELSNECQNVIARARLIAALPTSYFKDGQQRAWMRMIGESLALALSGDTHNAKMTLSMAEKFVAGRARETARIWYVKASFVTLAALALFGLGLFLVSFRVASEWEADFAGTIGLATLCGAIGAQFSLLFRLDKLHVDPGAGRDAHDIEAIIRMSMGVFAAIIAVAAVRADIALGFIVPNGSGQPVNGWLIPIVALLAGASERFVPGVLLKVETSLLNTEAVVEGTHLDDAPRDKKAIAAG